MQNKENFVRFLLGTGALIFGDFSLKSGRKSPYMINTGEVCSGETLSRFGCFYARTIIEKIELGIIPKDIDIIFGSAYKGIPLAVATSIALSAAFNMNVGYAFNRKVEKDHGEGGIFVGMAPAPGAKILIIDDVMTAGTALRETAELIKKQAPDVQIVGSVISVDRKERGRDGRLTAVAETQYELGIPVFSIVDIDEIVGLLRSTKLAEKQPAETGGEEDLGYTYRLDIGGKEMLDDIHAALPTEEQIVAIENYLAEQRPRRA